MKQTIAILLLGLLLFNWFGYRLWVDHLEAKANTDLQIALDNNTYDESQLISIKIPLTQLSYYNNSNEFVRVDGHIELHGVQYQFVKRRLFNDSLELFCIPNQAGTALQRVKNDAFKSVNDLQTNESGKKNASHPNMFKSFSQDEYIGYDLPGIINPSVTANKRSCNSAESLTSQYQFTSEHPPDINL